MSEGKLAKLMLANQFMLLIDSFHALHIFHQSNETSINLIEFLIQLHLSVVLLLSYTQNVDH